MDIVIPDDLWEDDSEAVIVTWIYSDGAVVEEGELITELMVEKAQLELHAPASGRLTVKAEPDTVVKKGDVIGSIEPV
jgi:pyruvate/2-oxoglutarate dehydrogenase complex dihydrolipoamide acyltransferase (E2) component